MECPPAERLAANELTPEERGAWLDHAADCAQCRAIAIVMTEDGPVTRERIGRFEIDQEIGRGAMGTVYVANDPELGRRVAIKVLHDATAVERLRREARALARLDHPNVVRIYDVGFEDHRAFVAMELIPGLDMRRWLAAKTRTRREILDVLVHAGRGLAAAHAAGIVHRDFKPDNVLVAPDRVVVGDFGLSRFGGEPSELTSSLDVSSEDNLTASRAVVGTPAYMAPEQALGDATASSDQFAFCVAAWEALLGTRPFAGTTLRELRAQAAAHLVLRPVNARLPRGIERVLRRGLAAEAKDRYPSMDALLAALVPDRRRRRAAIAVACLAALVTIGWWWAQRAPVDACAAIGETIFDGWTTEAKARVRAARGEAGVTELDRYAREWRAARSGLCRLTSSTLVALEQRVARETCYERARIEFERVVRDPVQPYVSDRQRTIPLAACEAGVALGEAPGTASDPRGCGCPYSPCVEGRCVGQCSARAFRLAGTVPGVSIEGRQEAVSGATPDGSLLLYLAGHRCALDHLYLARRVGGSYESIDLTPQLAGRGVHIREGCCTLANDGSALVIERRGTPGFLRFPLDGTQVGAPDLETLAAVVVPDAPAGTRLYMPMLSPDQRTFYFLRSDADLTHGLQAAKRTDVDSAFGTPSKVRGRAGDYEYATGLADDELTLFMAAEFATRVLLRDTRAQPFGDLGATIPPARLPGWRTIPLDGCRRLIATITPGGCEGEQVVFFEAVGP